MTSIAASETMLEVIAELAGRLSGVPLLMVLAGRSEPGAWLGHFPTANTVRLGPLGRCDATALSRVLVCDKPLAEEAADFLVTRAGGNPLYLRELVRMARTTGSLVDDGDCYRLGAAAAVPASLHAVLAARLDTLGSGQKVGVPARHPAGRRRDGGQHREIGRPGRRHRPGFARGRGAAHPDLDRRPRSCRPASQRSRLRNPSRDTCEAGCTGRRRALAGRPEQRARHLERAADYLSDDSTVAREASEMLADVGEEYAVSARYPEAQRVLERAVELGTRRPSVLLKLASLQDLTGDNDRALETLRLIEDDPADPSVAIERDHAVARVKMFTDPEAAWPELISAAEGWRALGRRDREAWAIGNAGVTSFNRSRMEQAAVELEQALDMFVDMDDRAGAVSCSSFLCIVKPADHRVPGWLADALAFADETGERAKQISALTPLAWNYFLRSMWGGSGRHRRRRGFLSSPGGCGRAAGRRRDDRAGSQPAGDHVPLDRPDRGIRPASRPAWPLSSIAPTIGRRGWDGRRASLRPWRAGRLGLRLPTRPPGWQTRWPVWHAWSSGPSWPLPDASRRRWPAWTRRRASPARSGTSPAV